MPNNNVTISKNNNINKLTKKNKIYIKKHYICKDVNKSKKLKSILKFDKDNNILIKKKDNSYVKGIISDDMTYLKEGTFGIIYRTNIIYDEDTLLPIIIKKSKKKHPNSTMIPLEESLLLKNDKIRSILERMPGALFMHRIDDYTIIMDEANGTLFDLKNQLTLKEAIDITIIIMKQLIYLYKHGLNYYDIKLSNILYKCVKGKYISIHLGDIGSIYPKNKDGVNYYTSTYRLPSTEYKNDIGVLKSISKHVYFRMSTFYAIFIFLSLYLPNNINFMTKKKMSVKQKIDVKELSNDIYLQYWDEYISNLIMFIKDSTIPTKLQKIIINELNKFKKIKQFRKDINTPELNIMRINKFLKLIKKST